MTNSTNPEQTPKAGEAPAWKTASLPPSAPRRLGKRRARVKGPTQEELDALPVKERLELLDRQRQSRHQTLNSIGILFGVVFTAGSLAATALSVRTTQNELHNSQQGQITDRYTKAIDQLGSNKLDIRLGGIYALERIASDSPRDDRTIYDVLCTFVREHATTPKEPTVDIRAALTVTARRKPQDDGFIPDLTDVRAPGTDLMHAKLTDADLSGADLSGANLTSADLSGANLTSVALSHAAYQRGALLPSADLAGAANLSDAKLSAANLSAANLIGAKLPYADLYRADLSDAKLSAADLYGADLSAADLYGADLSRANLSRADMPYANLTGANLFAANLSRADLYGADLTYANLSGADLSDADLRGVRGVTADAIRKEARINADTRF